MAISEHDEDDGVKEDDEDCGMIEKKDPKSRTGRGKV